MISYLWVGLGGALGSMLRFWLSGLIGGTRLGEIFPLGTLVINITGSFVIGFVVATSATEGRFYLSPMARQFLMIGICGGYTTFSSFSLQTSASRSCSASPESGSDTRSANWLTIKKL
jgi:fluoride exporter